MAVFFSPRSGEPIALGPHGDGQVPSFFIFSDIRKLARAPFLLKGHSWSKKKSLLRFPRSLQGFQALAMHEEAASRPSYFEIPAPRWSPSGARNAADIRGCRSDALDLPANKNQGRGTFDNLRPLERDSGLPRRWSAKIARKKNAKTRPSVSGVNNSNLRILCINTNCDEFNLTTTMTLVPQGTLPKGPGGRNQPRGEAAAPPRRH